MNLKASSSESSPLMERDGDTVMDDNFPTSPISPFREKFNFDWFKFDVGAKDQVLPSVTSVTAKGTTTNSTDSTNKSPSKAPQVLLQVSPPPSKPLNWVWQCHLCRSRYPLAVTRRCLVDGHYYCSGDASQRNIKRKRKAQSCASEFDYLGWEDWGRWRRKCLALSAFAAGDTTAILRGCEGCSFPSQCRYEKRAFREIILVDKQLTDIEKQAAEVPKPEVHIRPVKPMFLEQLQNKDRVKETTASSIFAKRKTKKFNDSESVRETKVNQQGIAKASKKNRFYNTADANTSTALLPPITAATNPSDKGTFDPALTSLQRQGPPAELLRLSGFVHDEAEILGTSLKAAVAHQPSLHAEREKSRGNGQQFATQSESRMDNNILDAKMSKQRSVSANEMVIASMSAARSYAHPSQTQTLLVDWFRPTRSNSARIGGSRSTDEGAKRRAASEADISSFLQLRTTQVDSSASIKSYEQDPTLVPKTVPFTDGRAHFEDIVISPIQGQGSQISPPNGLHVRTVSRRNLTLTDAGFPYDGRGTPDEVATGKGSGTSTSAGFLFSSLGFGKR